MGDERERAVRVHCRPEDPCRSLVETRKDTEHNAGQIADHEDRLRRLEALGARVLAWGVVGGAVLAIVIKGIDLGFRLLSTKGF